jgi:hypothetical protein
MPWVERHPAGAGPADSPSEQSASAAVGVDVSTGDRTGGVRTVGDLRSVPGGPAPLVLPHREAALFKRKKSLGGTRRELHQLLDASDREAAMNWWSGAEEVMQAAELSGPASFLAMTMAFAHDGDVRAAAGLNIVIRGGYALRALLPSVTGEVASLDVSSLDRQAIANLALQPTDPETGMLSPEDGALAGDVLGPSAELLGDVAASKFALLVSVAPAFWLGTASLATYQLHQNVGRLDEDLVEALLRYGFVLRAWEEGLGIACPGSVHTERVEPYTSRVKGSDQHPPGAVLDPGTWVKEAAVVCTSPFEPFAESLLELSTIELLGIQTIVQRYTGIPWSANDPAVEAGVAHARFGYALRNRETQLVSCCGSFREDDPIWALVIERAGNSGLKPAVAHRIVRDVIEFGDRDNLYETTPGTTADARHTGVRYWARTYGESDTRVDQRMTTLLIEHGYFLHRLFEIDHSYLD